MTQRGIFGEVTEVFALFVDDADALKEVAATLVASARAELGEPERGTLANRGQILASGILAEPGELLEGIQRAETKLLLARLILRRAQALRHDGMFAHLKVDPTPQELSERMMDRVAQATGVPAEDLGADYEPEES